jgi:hypothetical protein
MAAIDKIVAILVGKLRSVWIAPSALDTLTAALKSETDVESLGVTDSFGRNSDVANFQCHKQQEH